MKKTILIISIFCLFLIPTLTFSTDDFKASLTKESYYVGEDVGVMIDVTNTNPQKTTINWYIIFYPGLSKHPVTLTGGKTLAPKEHFSNVHKTKAEIPGDFKVNVKFVDADDKLIDEKNLTFSVKQNLWMYLIPIPIILIIIFFIYRKYRRKPEVRTLSKYS